MRMQAVGPEKLGHVRGNEWAPPALTGPSQPWGTLFIRSLTPEAHKGQKQGKRAEGGSRAGGPTNSSGRTCLKGTNATQHQLVATTWGCIDRVAQMFDWSTNTKNKDSYVESCFDADNKFSILKHICMHQTKHVYSQFVACGLAGTHIMKKIIYRNKPSKHCAIMNMSSEKSHGELNELLL